MKKIDFHVHAFPHKVAPIAVDALVKVIGPINRTNGTLEDTIKVQRQWGSDKYVLLNVPTAPKQQAKANAFLLEANGQDDGRILAFGAPHPLAPDHMEQLRIIVDAGLRGVKFHPEYQDFAIDDPAVYPLYEACAKHGLVMLFHGGEDPAFPGRDRAAPQRAARFAKDFAGAKIVIAHMGNSLVHKPSLEHLCGLDIYLDTSMAAQYMSQRHFGELVRAHGPSKVVYGTDCPWGGLETQQAILDLGLSTEENEMIFYKNAQKLLDVEV